MRKYQFATLGLCAFGLALFAACGSKDQKVDDVDTASNEAALGQIRGVGPVKIEKYGERFLEVLRSADETEAA